MSVPMSETGLIRAYSGLTRVMAPVLPIWLKRRALQGKEDLARQGERFGETDKARPAGFLIWMHGASIGEVTMMFPLIDRLLAEYQNAHILVTSGTVTSAKLLAERLPERAFHQYVPLDTPVAVSNFLSHWRPDLALWTESEIWPNLISQTKAAGIPMALVNARMSEKSIQNWFKRRKSAKALFGHFDLILAANEDTANGLSWLLGETYESAGNLKDAAPALPFKQAEYNAIRKKIAGRPVWCAASTHKGEDEIIIDAHREIRKIHKDALLILAPRHPDRRDEIKAMLTGDKFLSRSEGKTPGKTPSVYLFDTIGEMGLAYQLADVTFVCGSLVDGLMGHNPLEPARLNNAILTGAHISSFSDTFMRMFAFDAAQRVLNPDMIAETVNGLFSDADMMRYFQTQALDFAQSRDAVLDYVWDKLSPILPEKAA